MGRRRGDQIPIVLANKLTIESNGKFQADLYEGQGGRHKRRGVAAPGQLQITLGAPPDLMMLEKPASDLTASRVFIGLPRGAMLASFEGFQEIPREHLPHGLVMLIARKEGFDERFPDIAAKLKRCAALRQCGHLPNARASGRGCQGRRMRPPPHRE
jgi:hypothetical protein